MEIDKQQQRALFLEAIIKASSDLETVFLNHSGQPERLLTDIQYIDILADHKVFDKALNFIKTHELVSTVRQQPSYRMDEVWVEFHDHTELRFRLIRSFIWKGMQYMTPKYIRENAAVNSFGMLVPAESVHFEYLVLTTQFNKIHLADRYQNHFGALSFDERGIIFGHIHHRLGVVIHTLDDLYEYKAGTVFKIVLTFRKRKGNSLLRMTFRFVELFIYKLIKGIFFREKLFVSEGPKILSDNTKTEEDKAADRAVL